MAEAAANAAQKVGGAFTSAASATIRKAPIILGLGMAFLTVAALTGGGVAALAGSDPVTISKLGKGVVEGVVEGSTHVANSAQWVASKIGTTANSLPGVTNG
ncbi:MAG: hypothetical protein KA155_04710 [Alphaproteobacteria bacterium]|jgi:hypothetical protein|nr:hypothetical protein [Alphaproteobacteria bacterium]